MPPPPRLPHPHLQWLRQNNLIRLVLAFRATVHSCLCLSTTEGHPDCCIKACEAVAATHYYCEHDRILGAEPAREFDAQGLTNLAQSLAKLEIQRDNLHTALVEEMCHANCHARATRRFHQPGEEATPKISSFTNQEPMPQSRMSMLRKVRSCTWRIFGSEARNVCLGSSPTWPLEWPGAAADLEGSQGPTGQSDGTGPVGGAGSLFRSACATHEHGM